MRTKNKDTQISLIDEIQNYVYARSRESLLPFIMAINKDYSVNWHHRILANRLTKLANQKKQRIMIFLPPQTGKSEIVSRNFPAWILGVNPDLRIILASYSSDLASSFNRDTQKIITSEEYARIFPETSFNKKKSSLENSYKRTGNFFEIVNNRGYLFNVGVGGSTTGKSADIFIIDDPIKDIKQAYSEVTRASIIDWFNSVAQTRMSLNGHIIIMHTRWHENDLAGHLLEQQEKDPKATQWEIISIPAAGDPESKLCYKKDFRSEGDPLWPEFKGDKDHLQKVRQSVGEKVWSALYQQSPTIQGGNIIKSHWIQYYESLPFDLYRLEGNEIIQSWDLTFKETGTSFVVGTVIAKHGPNFYVVDFFRAKVDVVETMAAIRAMVSKYPKSSILIEDKANGPAVISMLKRQLSKIIPIKPTAGKDERLHVVAPLFEAGNVFFPQNAQWTTLAVNELQTFPASKNDDVIDSISQGLQHFTNKSFSIYDAGIF